MARVSDANTYRPTPAALVGVREETADIKTFRVQPEQALDYRPGQFAMLSLWGFGEAPFSIASSRRDGEVIEFSIKRAGAFTEQMHRLEVGDELGIRGPFGNGFDLEAARRADLVFVAGGIGLAPLRPLVHEVLAQRDQFGQVVLLYGARTPADLVYRDELARLHERPDLRLELTVDASGDGWTGPVGVVPGLVTRAPESFRGWTAFVCGPPIMIRFTAEALLAKHVQPDHLVTTLERQMRCGVGKCGHCYIGGKLVCNDGPVFTWQQLQEMGAQP